jgi:mannosyltransferase OCH1-like enzyme
LSLFEDIIVYISNGNIEINNKISKYFTDFNINNYKILVNKGNIDFINNTKSIFIINSGDYPIDFNIKLEDNVKIPKVIFQTSIYKPEKYIIDKILSKCNSYKYLHFNDEEIIDFFKKNYIEEFKNIIKKFNNISNGAHKADLFRYYFLYINGGIFIDSDAMIETNIENIVKNYEFISVNSNNISNSIFQGFIGSISKNNIIYEALKDIYNIDLNLLKNDYHLICKNLYNIIKNNNIDNIKLYDEKIFIEKGIAKILDKDILIMIHYWRDKIIPK